MVIGNDAFAQEQTKPKAVANQHYTSPEKKSGNTGNGLVTVSGDPHPGAITGKNEPDNAYARMARKFPHLPLNDGTGNYDAAKAEWVKNYPAEYEAWLKATAEPGPHKISAKEFKTMPKERQDHILNNPDKYIIAEDE